jgi:hypothetical protein
MEAFLISLFASGGVLMLFFQALKRFFGSFSKWLDGRPPLMKQILIFVISLVIGALAKISGLDLPLDYTTWPETTLVSLAVALVSYAFHSIKKALEAQRATT